MVSEMRDCLSSKDDSVAELNIGFHHVDTSIL